MTEYREELILSLSSARELAAMNVQAAQLRYKQQYGKTARPAGYQVGDWVLVRFPAEKNKKEEEALSTMAWPIPYPSQERP